MHNWIHLFELGMCLCNKYSTVNNFNKPTCSLNIFETVVIICLLLIKINFSKMLTGTLSECQMVCIRSVGTQLGPNYLQMLSADKESVGNLGNNS